MDSLRERVAKAMHECHPENDPKPWDWVVTDATRYAESIRQDADAAIAVFEAVLLSDEVVVAAGDVIAGEFYADLPMMTGEAYSQVAKTALQAALAAAKGTEGSE